MSIFFSLIIICFGFFCYYQNTINPAKFPLYEISNGEKTVLFQTMSHIASPEFCKEVQKEIYTAKNNGYVLFYEGVKPGKPENQIAFEKLL